MITFTLTDDSGEEVEVTADSRDVLIFERTSRTNERWTEVVSELRLVGLYRIAHIACKRQGIYEGLLKDFEEVYRLDVPAGRQQPVTPTSAGVSTET